MDQRQKELQNWLREVLNTVDISLSTLVGDASFRRYFRLNHCGKKYVVMDAPPGLETCELEPYIAIAHKFYEMGLQVPYIFHVNIKDGFLLISDLGNQLYFHELNESNVDQLYKNAIAKLFVIQSCKSIPGLKLESFNTKALMWELQRFTEWLVVKYLGIEVDAKRQNILENTYKILLENDLEQPQFCIHRDYHSRNLMILPDDEIGILDFQDAMIGAVTYDLVSLIRDCYIDWPDERIIKWTREYYDRAVELGLLNNVSFTQFVRWFDLMGMQRHLKASFIFARKFLRDRDDMYLKDIPRTLNYIKKVCAKYPELSEFQKLLLDEILPALQREIK
jgi:N-acetylmuramate 1-kinase